jgi:hypothetical protein
MFRLKAKPGEKAEPWMLKKVTDEIADPENGDALVDEGTTSVASCGSSKGGGAWPAFFLARPPF